MKSVLLAFFIAYASSGVLFAQENAEKDILASAIKIYASIDPDTDIKTRLRMTELVINKVDEILELYAATDVGLELLATDSFGAFSISDVRNKYLEDVITYNLKSCEASPSYSCFGFISLDNGNQKCAAGNDFSNFLRASSNFKNAYQIFKGQGDSKKNSTVVMQAYKRCVAKAPNQFSKDFMNSQLIGVLLENGDEQKAIGLTQNMSTRLFKLTSAADIRIFQGRYDLKTLYTLLSKQDSLETIEDKIIYNISLLNKFYDTGNTPFPANNQFAKFRLGGGAISPTQSFVLDCSSSQGKFAADIAIDLISNILADEKIDDGYAARLRSQTYDEAKQTSACNANVKMDFIGIGGNFPVNFSLNAINYMRENGSEEVAFADYLLKTSDPETIEMLIDIALTVLDSQKGTLDGFGEEWKENFISNTEFPFYSIDSKLLLFKWRVDRLDVCNSSGMFFNSLRGTRVEPEAIAYFTQSPNIQPTQTYNCGDEDLDLLIN